MSIYSRARPNAFSLIDAMSSKSWNIRRNIDTKVNTNPGRWFAADGADFWRECLGRRADDWYLHFHLLRDLSKYRTRIRFNTKLKISRGGGLNAQNLDFASVFASKVLL